MNPELQRAIAVLLTGRVDGIDSTTAVDGVEIASLEGVLERVDLRGGETLFQQGDPGDSLYVVTRGRLRLLLSDDDEVSAASELGPGQTVGELALLTGEPRTGTVTAVRDTVLYRLGREDFDRIAPNVPAITHHMLVHLAERLSHPAQRERRTAVPTNIAVLPAGVDAPVAELAEALARFMAEYVTAALVASESLERTLGEGASSAEPTSGLGVRVHDHLSDLEDANDFVIYAGDHEASAWSAKCAREADLILLAGRAGSDPSPNRLEHRLFDMAAAGTPARLHLVVVEPRDAATPVGTSAWLMNRPVEMCHHVHLERRSHLARLARFVAGTPVGLVLSGGAARAFAHVGVMQFLRDSSIPVDVVAGTSAGAVIGAQFAMGWSPERIVETSRRVFGGPRRKLIDVIPPFTSLIGSTGFNAALGEILGDVHFEDLWIQFMCTTTDLTSASARTHRRGRLRPAIRASCSLPMVMPPVPTDGHLLADGGIMNNLPVEPLLEVTGVGTLVVVNVANPFYTADESYDYTDSLSIGRVLNGRFNPFATKLVAPGIMAVLMRSLEIGTKSLEPAQVAKADVYIRPDVARYGYTDLAAIDEIVALGAREAAACVAEAGPLRIPFAGPGRAG